MRLIDADALKAKLIEERDAMPLTRTERYGFGVEFPNNHGTSMRGGINKAFRCMEQTPTIDAVEVVRCKDCKHWEKGDFMGGKTLDSMEFGGRCPFAKFSRYESDFCSRGERKDGDG